MTSPEASITPCVCGDPQCTTPFGYCHCGCPNKTPINKASTASRGLVRGMPRKYCKSHQFVKPRVHIDTDPTLPWRLIPLTKGMYAVVDVSDYEWLMRWVWSANYDRRRDTYYAVRMMSLEEGGDGTRKVRMHNAILPPPEGLTVDHASGDGINNRRENLRFATNEQQGQNTKLRKDNATGYKGVKPSGSPFKKFRADIKVDGRRIHLGGFYTAYEAHLAYEEAAEKYFGKFRRKQ